MKLDGDRELLHYFDIREGYRLVTSFSFFSDKRYIDQRIWFRTEHGAWAPTRKGFTISEKHSVSLAKSSAALLDADEH